MTVAELIGLLRARNGSAIVRIEGCCGHCEQDVTGLLDDAPDDWTVVIGPGVDFESRDVVITARERQR